MAAPASPAPSGSTVRLLLDGLALGSLMATAMAGIVLLLEDSFPNQPLLTVLMWGLFGVALAVVMASDRSRAQVGTVPRALVHLIGTAIPVLASWWMVKAIVPAAPVEVMMVIHGALVSACVVVSSLLRTKMVDPVTSARAAGGLVLVVAAGMVAGMTDTVVAAMLTSFAAGALLGWRFSTPGTTEAAHA